MEEKINELLKQAGVKYGASAHNYFEVSYLTLYEKLIKLVSESEAERIFKALVKDEDE